jgi:quinol monooxygenase YgiN
MHHLMRALLAVLATSLMTGTLMTSANAQSASAVHVVTYLDIAPDSVAKAKPLLQLYRDAAGKSNGSEGIDVFQEIGRPGRIVVREAWADQKAFEAHGKSQAATVLAGGLKPFEVAPADQRVHIDFTSGAGPARAASGAVHVFSHVDVPPPRQGDLEPMLKAVQAASIKEATSVRFDVLQQASRKNHFTVVEAWSSRKALEAQAMAPAQRAFRDKLGPMLGALYDQRLYRAIR